MSNAHWSRLTHFDLPLRQRMRKQCSWTPAWRLAIDQSPLPNQVKQLLYDVVGNLQLMRFEKAEVAEELIAHFIDGHERGHCFDDLIVQFGSPENLTSLIQSSKQRNRPMMFRIMRIGAVAIALLGAFYFTMIVIFHLASPNPSVDYSSAFNQAALASAPEQRAWQNYYREMWRKYGLAEGGGGKLEAIFADLESRTLVRPGDADWNDAVDFIHSAQDLLDALREGGKLESFGLVLLTDPNEYSEEDRAALFPNRDQIDLEMGTQSETANDLLDGSAMSVLLPHVQSFRTISQLLTVDSRLALEESQPERVIENANAVLGMSKQIAESDILVNSLVSHAIRRQAAEMLSEALMQQPAAFDDNQLAQLQAGYEAIPPAADSISLAGEKSIMLDMVQRIYSDDGNGSGRITPEGLEVLNEVRTMYGGIGRNGTVEAQLLAQGTKAGRSLLGPMTLMTSPSRAALEAQINATSEQAEAALKQPIWDQPVDDLNIDKYDFDFGPMNYAAINYGNIKRAMVRDDGLRQGAILAVAAQRFYLENQRWPRDTDELAEGWVRPEDTIDPLTGDPVRIASDDSGITIYSLGANREDDGGVGSSDFPTGSADGDWILWPVSGGK